MWWDCWGSISSSVDNRQTMHHDPHSQSINKPSHWLLRLLKIGLKEKWTCHQLDQFFPFSLELDCWKINHEKLLCLRTISIVFNRDVHIPQLVISSSQACSSLPQLVEEGAISRSKSLKDESSTQSKRVSIGTKSWFLKDCCDVRSGDHGTC